MQTPPHIVPEWYFLPFYAILRAIPDALGGAVAMTLSVIIFAAMPYLDRSKVPGGAKYRPIYRAMFYVFMINIGVLSVVGVFPPVGYWNAIGRIATLIYFGTFLLLPIASVWEEKWLRARGLPPDVLAMMDAEAKARQARPVR